MKNSEVCSALAFLLVAGQSRSFQSAALNRVRQKKEKKRGLARCLSGQRVVLQPYLADFGSDDPKSIYRLLGVETVMHRSANAERDLS
jgi:hypothetical protein